MPSGGPLEGSPPTLRWSNWNLLLLIPLISLVTPLYNAEEPRLLGFPFFYWTQFLFVPLGVLCVAVVYRKTRNLGDPADRDADGGVRQ